MSVRSLVDPRAVAIIIPQYDQPTLTIQAIQSLRRVDPVRWPVLVVDNGSSPDSVRQLHGMCDPDVRVLALPCAGLTTAWNTAATSIDSEYLVFLNNDTLSFGPWVEALLLPLLQGTALVTGVALRRELHLSPPVELLAGWCFALQRQTLESVRGFDTTMALYFSDTDLLLRVRGHFSLASTSTWSVVPGLPITHLSHRTAHRLPNQQTRWLADREKFLSRWRECP